MAISWLVHWPIQVIDKRGAHSLSSYQENGMRKRKLLTVIATCLILASCKGGDPLVGRWQEVEGDGWSEYFTDGSAILNDGSMSISGTWKRLEDGRLKIDATVLGINTAEVYQVSIEGDTATFTNSEGEVERYQRASAPAESSASGQVKSTPVSDDEAQRQTVADIRNTGTAMFSWLTDQIGSGAAGQSQIESASQRVNLGQYPLISREELEKILVPRYLQTIPEKDGWGHAYEFYLNAANVTGAQVMSIRSPGRDGMFSATDYRVGPFPPNSFDEDIVWSDGFFVRWPEALGG